MVSCFLVALQRKRRWTSAGSKSAKRGKDGNFMQPRKRGRPAGSKSGKSKMGPRPKLSRKHKDDGFDLMVPSLKRASDVQNRLGAGSLSNAEAKSVDKRSVYKEVEESDNSVQDGDAETCNSNTSSNLEYPTNEKSDLMQEPMTDGVEFAENHPQIMTLLEFMQVLHSEPHSEDHNVQDGVAETCSSNTSSNLEYPTNEKSDLMQEPLTDDVEFTQSLPQIMTLYEFMQVLQSGPHSEDQSAGALQDDPDGVIEK